MEFHTRYTYKAYNGFVMETCDIIDGIQHEATDEDAAKLAEYVRDKLDLAVDLACQGEQERRSGHRASAEAYQRKWEEAMAEVKPLLPLVRKGGVAFSNRETAIARFRSKTPMMSGTRRLSSIVFISENLQSNLCGSALGGSQIGCLQQRRCPIESDYRHRRRQLVRWIGDLRSAGLGAFNAARITISLRASGICRCDRWRYHSNGPREPTGLPRKIYRVSGRDVRGGTVGGSSQQVGAIRGVRDTAGRDVPHRLFGGDSLSSDVLCVRVGNDER